MNGLCFQFTAAITHLYLVIHIQRCMLSQEAAADIRKHVGRFNNWATNMTRPSFNVFFPVFSHGIV